MFISLCIGVSNTLKIKRKNFHMKICQKEIFKFSQKSCLILDLLYDRNSRKMIFLALELTRKEDVMPDLRNRCLLKFIQIFSCQNFSLFLSIDVYNRSFSLTLEDFLKNILNITRQFLREVWKRKLWKITRKCFQCKRVIAIRKRNLKRPSSDHKQRHRLNQIVDSSQLTVSIPAKSHFSLTWARKFGINRFD